MHPRQSKSPIFEEIGEIWAVGVVNSVVLACVLRATIKKSRKLWGGEKCTPEKILATPMVLHRPCVMQTSSGRGSEAAGVRRTTTTVLPSMGLGVGVGRPPTVQHPSARRQRHMGQIAGLSVMKQGGLDLEIFGKPAVTPAATKTAAVPTAVAATGCLLYTSDAADE